MSVPGAPPPSALLLALDAGSPTVSVALGRDGALLARRASSVERSSDELLALIDEALAELGAAPRDLGGVIALRGPGSFTGLRVGLATALGLRDALGIPAAAPPTLQALAVAAGAGTGVIAAAVNAMRGEWFVERFAGTAPPKSLGAPVLVAADAVSGLEADVWIGFGLAAAGVGSALEPPPLAASALALAFQGGLSWDAGKLVQPLYLREAATTPARR